MSRPKYVKLMARLCELEELDSSSSVRLLPSHGSWCRKRYPASVYHHKSNAIRRRLPDTIPDKEWPVRDVDVIQRLARYYPTLYPVFLREARRPYGMDQMAEYYQSITFWYCFLKYVSPDLLVYNSIPARIYDFLP
ncbi:MAG: hypothetical protein U5P41_09055 [Gammaproteobacteria bacterium]|nr:hypothetical protein [Gammaproteobacteria bacterium]